MLSNLHCASCSTLLGECMYRHPAFVLPKVWCEKCNFSAVAVAKLKRKLEFKRILAESTEITEELRQRLLAVRAIHEELQAYSDVKLQPGTGAEAIPAHRAVLAARSPVFKAMFNNMCKEQETGLVYLEDTTAPVLKAFTVWLYSGYLESEVLKDHGLGLLAMAHKYQIPALARDVDDVLSKCPLTMDEAFELIRTATQFEAPKLRLSCLTKIKKQPAKDLPSCPQFKDFIMSDSKEDRMLGLDILACMVEDLP